MLGFRSNENAIDSCARIEMIFFPSSRLFLHLLTFPFLVSLCLPDSQLPVSLRATFSLVRWTGSSAAQGGGGLASFDSRVAAGSILYISVEAGLSLGVSAGSILQVR